MPINTKVPGPRFGRISWDKSGTSLFFTYRYTSKKDGKNYTDTYVVNRKNMFSPSVQKILFSFDDDN